MRNSDNIGKYEFDKFQFSILNLQFKIFYRNNFMVGENSSGDI
jgi:hypothetical protein